MSCSLAETAHCGGTHCPQRIELLYAGSLCKFANRCMHGFGFGPKLTHVSHDEHFVPWTSCQNGNRCLHGFAIRVVCVVDYYRAGSVTFTLKPAFYACILSKAGNHRSRGYSERVGASDRG